MSIDNERNAEKLLLANLVIYFQFLLLKWQIFIIEWRIYLCNSLSNL